MFALIFLGLLGSVYGYSGWRLIPHLPASLHYAVALALVVMLFLPLSLFYLRARPNLAWLADALAWVSYLGMGFATFSTILLAVRDIVGQSLSAFTTIAPALNARIDLTIFALAIAVASWGFYQARRTPAIRRIDVPIPDLPPALIGLRIAQFSDLHVGPTIKGRFVARVVARINAEQPDIIAFTGDLADGSVDRLAPHTAALAELSAPLGVYFCTGNHDYYSGIEQWTAHASLLGFEVLVNEGRLLNRNGACIGLAGATDYSAGEMVSAHASAPDIAHADIADADLRILLAHQPRSIEAASAAGFHLQLSGHTHGGQFVPWNFVVLLQQPYVAGLHKFRDTLIYIHRGTGYWGPPLRLGAPSEIALLTLTHAHTP